MLKKLFPTLFAALLLASLAAPLAANATPSSRVENQRDRISNGFRGGSISGQQRQLDLIRLHAIRQEMHVYRHYNDGTMTQRERHAIYRQLNGLGERIHDQRHRPPH